jgi:hypothetical protein
VKVLTLLVSSVTTPVRWGMAPHSAHWGGVQIPPFSDTILTRPVGADLSLRRGDLGSFWLFAAVGGGGGRGRLDHSGVFRGAWQE